MRLGFLTAAIAAGLAGAAVAWLAAWMVAVVGGDPLGLIGTVTVVLLAALLVATATFLAEEVALRRTYAGMSATGETWAYRER
jgi:hypothetical protein